MIKIIVAAIVAILVFGLLFKLIKVALLLAIGLGMFIFARNFLGNRRIK